MTNDELTAWRADIERNVAGFRSQLRAIDLEIRAKERALAVAEAGSLKAGKYKARAQNGGVMDVNANVANELRLKLIELETNAEVLEIAIVTAVEELDGLPIPEPAASVNE